MNVVLRRASVLAMLTAASAAPAVAFAQSPAKAPTAAASSAAQTAPAPSASARSPEQQRQDAERSAQGEVNQDAAAVIRETRNALDAIAKTDKASAIAALERATGKVNILLARNPATALIPESVEVVLHDTAPSDRSAITAQTDAILAAINRRDYALARVLLDSLRSEIRIRTSNVPLATYPAALREAARLLEAGKNEDAAETLRAALSTVVIIDRALALPLIRAAQAIEAAQDLSGKQKAEALRHLAVARSHLEQAQALGYLDADKTAGLTGQIAAVETLLQRNQNAATAFAKLRGDLGTTSREQSDATRRGRAGG